MFFLYLGNVDRICLVIACFRGLRNYRVYLWVVRYVVYIGKKINVCIKVIFGVV